MYGSCNLSDGAEHALPLKSVGPYGIRSWGMANTALRLVDKDTMDKQKALDAALGQIERAFGKGSIMKLGSRDAAAETEGISTGSLALGIALCISGPPAPPRR